MTTEKEPIETLVEEPKSNEYQLPEGDNGYVRGQDGWVHLNIECHPNGAGVPQRSSQRQYSGTTSDQESWPGHRNL